MKRGDCKFGDGKTRVRKGGRSTREGAVVSKSVEVPIVVYLVFKQFGHVRKILEGHQSRLSRLHRLGIGVSSLGLLEP